MMKVKLIPKKNAFVNFLSFTKTNYVLFGIGVGIIIIGYLIMASGETYSFRSLTLAPLVLLVGYLLLIPIALLYRQRKDSGKKEN